jgi:hypothetical protein
MRGRQAEAPVASDAASEPADAPHRARRCLPAASVVFAAGVACAVFDRIAAFVGLCLQPGELLASHVAAWHRMAAPTIDLRGNRCVVLVRLFRFVSRLCAHVRL